MGNNTIKFEKKKKKKKKKKKRFTLAVYKNIYNIKHAAWKRLLKEIMSISVNFVLRKILFFPKL